MSDDGMRRETPKGLSVALTVSLCLNFLVLGALAMMVWRWPYPPHGTAAAGMVGDGPRGPGFGNGMGRGRGHGPGGPVLGLGQGLLNPHVLAKAAPGKADAIGKILDSHRQKLDVLRDASFDARRAAARLLVADDFTPAAFDRALDALRAADTALESEILKTVADCARLLTPEERREAMRLGAHKRGGGRWRH